MSFPNLTPEQRERWENLAAALRSGKYKQTHGVLRFDSIASGDQFCCLGVACELVKDREDVRGEWIHGSGTMQSRFRSATKFGDWNGSSTFPTEEVVNVYGGRDVRPLMDQMVTWNDSEECSFDEIAERIEQALSQEVT